MCCFRDSLAARGAADWWDYDCLQPPTTGDSLLATRGQLITPFKTRHEKVFIFEASVEGLVLVDPIDLISPTRKSTREPAARLSCDKSSALQNQGQLCDYRKASLELYLSSGVA